MKPLPFTLPDPLRYQLQDVGWSHTAFGSVDKEGTPVMVWYVGRVIDLDTEGRPLLSAALLSRADALLAALPDPHAANKAGKTPLHLAVRHPPLLARLLAAGAPVDARDHQGATPLHDALRSGNEESVNRLVAAGAAVCAATPDLDALLAAVVGDNPALVARMLASGFDPNRRLGPKQKTCLMHVNHRQEPNPVLELLLAAGADASLRATDGDSALIRALACGAPQTLVERLCAVGAPVAQAAPGDHSPLVTAAMNHPTLIPFLLDAGASPTETWIPEANAPDFVLDAPSALARHWLLNEAKADPLPQTIAQTLEDLLNLLLCRGAPTAQLDAYLRQQTVFATSDKRLEANIAHVHATMLAAYITPQNNPIPKNTRFRM